MPAQMMERIRNKRPIVHCITNYVTANDCANLLLAAGASPIMADDAGEVEEIVSGCGGLVLNMGTPNPAKLNAMRLAGKCANKLGIPVVLDPVGVAASSMRRQAVLEMLEEIRFSVIRGNVSEIRSLMRENGEGSGLDASAADDPAEVRTVADHFAARWNCVVLMTGVTDVVTDGKRGYLIGNGHEMMRMVTGAGCQLSALAGAYAAVSREDVLKASLAAACSMGICGEIAAVRSRGNAGFRSELIDAMYCLEKYEWEKMARYEKYKGNA